MSYINTDYKYCIERYDKEFYSWFIVYYSSSRHDVIKHYKKILSIHFDSGNIYRVVKVLDLCKLGH